MNAMTCPLPTSALSAMAPATPHAVPRWQIHCRMQHEAAGLERVLQVLRIRGFDVEDMQARRDGDDVRLALTVCGERRIENLLAQLTKLHTVHAAEACPILAQVRRAL